MRGRAFLDVARELVLGVTEAHWRAAVIHAYYALFLECRDVLVRWRIAILPRANVHSAVRLRIVYSADADVNSIGYTLDTWSQRRNRASYDLRASRDFASDAVAQRALVEITGALALLDALDAAPARRAAAIAAFPP
jgi:hypothetical protein